MANQKCSPQLWKKMTPLEKKLWTELYDAFVFPCLYHPDWSTKDWQRQREVTAHNLALQALWTLEEVLEWKGGCLEGKKIGVEHPE
ncbi:MAG: hypothetical protein [Siphoviridae sp. ctpQM7]|nr:MAG: hypothetical protein [Siphoviridae sp. ctpQM7]